MTLVYMHVHVLGFVCVCVVVSICPHVRTCTCSYLADGVGYLLHCLKREKERPAAFRAMGQMVYVLKDRMDLEPVLNTIKNNLPTGKEVIGK